MKLYCDLHSMDWVSTRPRKIGLIYYSLVAVAAVAAAVPAAVADAAVQVALVLAVADASFLADDNHTPSVFELHTG
jgi:hypothetical protein